VVDAMSGASGHPVSELRADGGASVNDLMLQLQADLLQVPVTRPVVQETTALGSAFLAGMAEGVWGGPADVQEAWQLDTTFEPATGGGLADDRHARWHRAVERSRGWSED
jgi:glycerol kinase